MCIERHNIDDNCMILRTALKKKILPMNSCKTMMLVNRCSTLHYHKVLCENNELLCIYELY